MSKINSSNPRILILGSAGYIGTRLTDFLIGEGFDVTGVDLCLYGSSHGTQVVTDIDNLTCDFLYDFDYIVHLAQYASPRVSKSPFATFRDNTQKFMHLIEKINGQTFIYISSSSVYDESDAPAKEDDKLSRRNLYEVFKGECDMWLQMTSMNYYSLRLGTVCGYSPRLRTDTSINRMTIDASLNGTITLDKSAVNSYRAILHIEDFCKAIKHFITYQPEYGVYNIAGFNMTMGDLAAEFAKKFGTHISVRPSDGISPSFKIDSTKFLTSFDQKMSDVNDIIENLVENLNKYKETPISERNYRGL